MAKITAATSEKVIPIKQWSGLHESPDGDTKLKYGEAAAIQNWRVTRDGNLQRRPGYRSLIQEKVSYVDDKGNTKYKLVPKKLANGPIKGMWTGFVNKKEVVLAACNGHIYSLWNSTTGDWYKDADGLLTPSDIGACATTNDVHMFGFEGKVYFMNGSQYKCWDGTHFEEIADNSTYFKPYIPLVAVSITPDPSPSSKTLEQINKLSAKRRCWLSPDGTGTKFYIPEKNWSTTADDYKLIDLTTNTEITSGFTLDAPNGTITFDNPPAQAANGIEFQYKMSTDFSSQVKAMRYSELFSGMTDSRVFIYGDGSNEIFYSSIDYWGEPRADYFPDLNEAAIGDANTPVTALIRHYSKLVIFKSDSTWSCSFNIVNLADGSSTEALYIYPVNKRLGHTPLGQTALVLNSPRSLYGNDVYEWKNNNAYAANLSVDERQAKRISDRIYKSISNFDLKSCVCWDDNDAQEYWICQNGKALVQNYAVDAWYYYTNIYANCFLNFHKVLYFGDPDGYIQYFDYDYNTDNGEVIDSYWESGSMDFGADYMRKYSAMLWLGIKPVSNGEVEVYIHTDKKPVIKEKLVLSQLATFLNVDFNNWSFNTNQLPHIFRRKIKAKKFVYYKLVFKNNGDGDHPNTSAIITASEIRVRYTGNAK